MNQINDISEMLKALSDPTRLTILKMLNEAETMLCVNFLANRLQITQSAVSQHLKILRQANLVISERRGYFIHYKVNETQLKKVPEIIKSLFF